LLSVVLLLSIKNIRQISLLIDTNVVSAIDLEMLEDILAEYIAQYTTIIGAVSNTQLGRQIYTSLTDS
jgi:hypothetical protein